MSLSATAYYGGSSPLVAFFVDSPIHFGQKLWQLFPQAGGLSVILPDARLSLLREAGGLEGSPGFATRAVGWEVFALANFSGNAVDVKDNAGTTLGTLAASTGDPEWMRIHLFDGSTQAGVWLLDSR